MATKKKMLQAAAGNAGGGGGLNVEDVFSTYLYTGNGSTLTITNGIDLAGEGGLVWGKARSQSFNHQLMDTERGIRKVLVSNTTDAEASNGDISAFNADGFSLSTGNNLMLSNGQEFASWTFRKAPKFFDVVTYTGTGAAQTISHNLGATVGSIFIKCTSHTSNWAVYHKGLTDPSEHYLLLNSTTGAVTHEGSLLWNSTLPTDSEFSIGAATVHNISGRTYVAYLFAHNDGDGEFGPDGDADIIKCGIYQSTGSISEISVDLGFEPQFVMAKAASTTGNWHFQDSMRGMAVGSSNNPYLQWNTSDSESADGTAGGIVPTSNGFRVGVMGDINIFNAVQTYIYIAIRRGTKVPESATEVFDIDTEGSSEPYYNSGFPVDFGLQKRHTSSGSWFAMSRLTQGRTLKTESTSAEIAEASANFDYMNGFVSAAAYGSGNSYGWMWKRAPGYFDVVCYEWNGTATRNVEHNLGVPPEMYIVKRRNSTTGWYVRHKDFFGTNGSIVLNTTAATAQTGIFTTGGTTDTTFPVANDGSVNASGGTYIAYLFATLDGISKVGSYTGNGGSGDINVDCGFSSGARFVLIKDTTSANDWYVWDSERGIVSGNDPYLRLNLNSAEDTTSDWIDPYSAGFTVTTGLYANLRINVSGNNYIFYAIA